MKVLTLLIVVTFLSACATQKDFESKLGSWIGHSEESLIASWGPPTSVYESGSNKYLTWSHSASALMPGISPTYQTNFIGNTAYTTSYGGTSPMLINTSCAKTMVINNGYVKSWSWKGNNCFDF
jgi:hypothetical protein